MKLANKAVLPSALSADKSPKAKRSGLGEIHSALLHAAYGRMPLTILMASMCALVLGGIGWPFLPSTPLAIWVGTILVVSLEYGVFLMWFKRAAPAEPALLRWDRLFTVHAALAGLAWSIGPVLMIPEGSLFVALPIAILLCVCGVGTISYVEHRKGMQSFLVCALVPPSVAAWQANESLMQLMALALLIGMVVFVVAGYEANKTIRLLYLERAKFHAAMNTANAANDAKSQFLANISHEISLPVNGVIGMTDLALNMALNNEQRGYLHAAKSSAQSLLLILNDVLDFSKIEVGKLNIEHIPFSLRHIVMDTLAAIEMRAAVKGLKLVCELPADLPGLMRGDPGRMRQVLTILCDNAIKFTRQGQIVVRAKWAYSGAGAVNVKLYVRDTGIGIPEDKQKLIFTAFSQVDASTTPQFGDRGLGLTISARLVELMGGRIGVKSQVHQGSTFYFSAKLGRVAGLGDPPPADGRSTTVTDDPSVLSSQYALSVLLVDDNKVNQILAIKLLERWGHKVALAENGREAVDLFPTESWDLILMDLQMPVMNGLEATGLIRALESAEQHVPIIAMTTHAMESDRELGREVGIDDYLFKPLTRVSLQEMLSRHCPAVRTVL